MRKQIIKFFALDYTVFMFGRRITWTRSANVIFPLVLLSGYLTMSDSLLNYCLIPIAYCLLAIALFFGFIYFRIKPLKQADYDYFDEVQQYVWNAYHHKATEQPKNYTPQWMFWVNPVLFTLTLLYCLLNF